MFFALLFCILSCQVPVQQPTQAASIQVPTVTDFDPQWRTNYILSRTTLLESIRAAIIPSYQDWVIFENGSYIIFDHIDTIADPIDTAKKWLAHYQNTAKDASDWSVSITDLDYSEGWSIFGNGYGIYTFVHLLELKDETPPKQVGNYAKWKRAKDERNPKIIYLHSSSGLQRFK
jgi:hypothetical protein